MSTHNRWARRRVAASVATSLALSLLVGVAPALAQRINVKAATPSAGEQGSVDLQVVIAGSGFGPGAQARFVLSGTDNPDGIRVKNTQFVSSTQLVATIDIDDAASLAFFDIKVALNGRSGKGTDLFQVVQKVAACEAGTYELAFTPLEVPAWPSDLACGPDAGRLDCTFGVQGRWLDALLPAPARAIDMTPEPDGSLLILAEGRPPGVSADTAASAFYVLRFLPDGGPDTSFGTGGVAHVAFTAQADWERPRAITRQADGRILVAGSYPQNRGGRGVGAVARFMPDGQLDTTFGSFWRVSLTFGKSGATVSDLVVLSDGRIVAATSIDDKVALTRLLPTGAVDDTYGVSGASLLSVGATSANLHLGGIAIQLVGGVEHIVAAGNAPTCQQDDPDIFVARALPDGRVDTSFGRVGNGVTVVDFAQKYEEAYDVAVDDAGRVIVAGRSFSAAALVRLSPGGELDATFGDGGAVLSHVTGPGAGLLRVAVDHLGRIVTAGWHATEFDEDFLVQRYLDSGTPDATFGQAGSVITAFPGGGYYDEWPYALGVQPDGRVVLAGKAAGVVGAQPIALAGYRP